MGDTGLWQIDASGAQSPRRLGSLGANAYAPAISSRTRRLAYMVLTDDPNIYRLNIAAEAGKKSSPEPFIVSTVREWGANYSPDGKRITFSSDRSGVSEIWECDADGSHERQLTAFGKGQSGASQFSPDSRQIAFDSSAGGNQLDIYVIDANGGLPKRLTHGPAANNTPSWSSDGKWIYFSSRRTGRAELWKIPAQGGKEVQVTRDGGEVGLESPDGRFLFYIKRDDEPIWRLPLNGGDAKPITGPEYFWSFAVSKKGIYYLQKNRAPGEALQFLGFGSSKPQLLATIPKPIWPRLTVSPDEQWILYTQIDQEGSDLMLVEDFH